MNWWRALASTKVRRIEHAASGCPICLTSALFAAASTGSSDAWSRFLRDDYASFMSTVLWDNHSTTTTAYPLNETPAVASTTSSRRKPVSDGVVPRNVSLVGDWLSRLTESQRVAALDVWFTSPLVPASAVLMALSTALLGTVTGQLLSLQLPRSWGHESLICLTAFQTWLATQRP